MENYFFIALAVIIGSCMSLVASLILLLYKCFKQRHSTLALVWIQILLLNILYTMSLYVGTRLLHDGSIEGKEYKKVFISTTARLIDFIFFLYQS